MSDAPSGVRGPGGRDPGGAETTACVLAHHRLMSRLGAWALAACPPQEAALVETHLGDCPHCAEEALRLRDAATFLAPPRSLDMDAALRTQVLDTCFTRRPAQQPIPSWAAPYDAETARLDALLNDMAADEWRTPVVLHWFEGDTKAERTTTVAGTLEHLLSVDGLLARVVGLPDPLGPDPAADAGPVARTEARWRSGAATRGTSPHHARLPWREQSWALVRAAAELGGRTGEHTVAADAYGDPGLFPVFPGGPGGPGRGATLSLSDAYLHRAFACWTHAADIAEAVTYPYAPPAGPHLRLLVDLTARRLPGCLAARRRAGLATSPARLTTAGTPGRTLHLEIEGPGGGDWYLSLDSPGVTVTRTAARGSVAYLALDDVVFCQLAAGRITPEEAAAGGEGDQSLLHDVLYAVAALSQL